MFHCVFLIWACYHKREGRWYLLENNLSLLYVGFNLKKTHTYRQKVRLRKRFALCAKLLL